nr:MAG TPA: hypothetical protein [Caudoviricetes sp.]
MQDRVPVNPGRVKITPEGGSAYYATMVRADNPTQEGTPLSKDTLFSAAAEGKYPDGVDTPSKAFEEISNRLPKVGDIKTTVRADLGDKWLLCNGDTISDSEYPELVQVLPASDGLTKTLPKTNVSSTHKVYCHNGVWVITGTDSGGYLYIFTATDPNGVWVERKICDTSGFSAGATYNNIVCCNGVWVITANLKTSGRILSATDPTGTWTLINPNYGDYYLKDITYYNGKWVAILNYYSGSTPYIATCSTLDGTWTKTSLSSAGLSSSSLSLRNLYVYNGMLVMTSGEDNSVYTATNPTGTWARHQVASSATVYDVRYQDGHWVASGRNSSSYPSVWIATNIDGTWIEKVVATQPNVSLDAITYTNGKWIAAGNYSTEGYAYVTTGPTGEWTQVFSGSTNYAIDVYGEDGVWVGATTNYNIFYGGIPLLPTLEADKSYVYIKAKE